MNGADMRAPPGILRNPKRAGIVARSTLPGSTVLRPSMNLTMSPVSFKAKPRTDMRATAMQRVQVLVAVIVLSRTSKRMAGGCLEVSPIITAATVIAA